MAKYSLLVLLVALSAVYTNPIYDYKVTVVMSNNEEFDKEFAGKLLLEVTVGQNSHRIILSPQ